MIASTRILVIDDSPLVVEAVRDALELDAIDVDAVAALDGLGPLDGYALILVDVHLPGGLGDALAASLRDRAPRGVPIVLLSSLAEGPLAARAAEAGLDGYILKQAGIERVADEVRAWIAGRRQRRDKGR